MFDFLRKCIYKIILNFNLRILNSIRSFYYFKSLNIKVGKRVSLLGYSSKLKIGKDINIYNNCIFELGPNSNLCIDDHIIFSYGVVLCCHNQISIGSNVQIGEYTSIRDTTHDYNEYGKPIMFNEDISEKIIIGNNVWIGRNCLVTPGSVIEDGVVVGANSIVKGHLEKDCIYAGTPAIKIKNRV
jgi:acetyltransferase-like isoleucine patch superfamily enzyme